jgi:PKD repeat protein
MKQSVARVLLFCLTVSVFTVCTVSATCSIVGNWNNHDSLRPEVYWTTSFNSDGTWSDSSGGSGSWNVVDVNNRIYQFTVGGVNNWQTILSSDCSSYTATAEWDSNYIIYGTRLNSPPVAQFTVSPSDTPIVNDILTFTSTSTDPDNAISELIYQWVLPDGSISNAQSVTYKFLQTGTFTVKLTVTDPSGASSIIEQRITIVEVTSKITLDRSDRKVVVNYPVAFDSRLSLWIRLQTEPAGGTYQWSIVKGADKIKIINNPQNSDILIQGIAPSKKPDDVELKSTYTYHSQTFTGNIKLTVQKPTNLKEYKAPDTTLEYSIFNPSQVSYYTTLYHYQIVDQFDQPINSFSLSLTEYVTYLCSNSWQWQHSLNNYPHTIGVDTINGRFSDVLKPEEYPYGIPSLVTTRYEQTMISEGWSLPLRCLNYYYNNGVSEKGRCSKCGKVTLP